MFSVSNESYFVLQWRGKPAVTKTKIAAHFSEPPASAAPVVPVVVAPVLVPEPVAVAPVVAKPAAVADPVATITNQSHAPKPRTEASTKHSPFDGHLDPVSTLAPSAPANMLIPLIVALLLGLLLGYIVGVYYGSTERIIYEVTSTATAAKGKQ